MSNEIIADSKVPTSEADVLDLFNADSEVEETATEEPEVTIEEEPEETEDEVEVDEPEEDEEVEEEPEVEELELVTPVRRKEILAKYPTLFKDFPYLESAYYREQKYTELFPTLVDAQEASERSQEFARLESELSEGKTEIVLNAVKESDPKAFARMVDNYLPALQKADPNAYNHVLSNVFKQAVSAMFHEGQRTENENLQSAASMLHQFVFGTTQWVNPTSFAQDKDNPEQTKLQQEREQFQKERFDTVRNELVTKADNAIRATVDKNIDPKGAMTDFVKRNAIRDCVENLEKVMVADSRFRSYIDKLWDNAHKSNYSKQTVDAIRSAYLAKAKTYLPQIIAKARNEALKGMGRGNTPVAKKAPLPVGRSAASSNSGKEKKAFQKGMSVHDFLMSD